VLLYVGMNVVTGAVLLGGLAGLMLPARWERTAARIWYVIPLFLVLGAGVFAFTEMPAFRNAATAYDLRETTFREQVDAGIVHGTIPAAQIELEHLLNLEWFVVSTEREFWVNNCYARYHGASSVAVETFSEPPPPPVYTEIPDHRIQLPQAAYTIGFWLYVDDEAMPPVESMLLTLGDHLVVTMQNSVVALRQLQPGNVVVRATNHPVPLGTWVYVTLYQDTEDNALGVTVNGAGNILRNGDGIPVESVSVTVADTAEGLVLYNWALWEHRLTTAQRDWIYAQGPDGL
jgi:hypothetical protein